MLWECIALLTGIVITLAFLGQQWATEMPELKLLDYLELRRSYEDSQWGLLASILALCFFGVLGLYVGTFKFDTSFIELGLLVGVGATGTWLWVNLPPIIGKHIK